MWGQYRGRCGLWGTIVYRGTRREHELPKLLFSRRLFAWRGKNGLRRAHQLKKFEAWIWARHVVATRPKTTAFVATAMLAWATFSCSCSQGQGDGKDASVAQLADGAVAPAEVPEANTCVAPPPLPPVTESDEGSGFVERGFNATAPVYTNEQPPAPIAGGTLTVLSDGVTAVVADPDRDQLFAIDLAAGSVVATARFGVGAQPWRHIESGAGRSHVVLRGAGALATVDLKTGAIAWQIDVCPEPRGLALGADGHLHVACAGGELVSVSLQGKVTRTLRLASDLRDIVADGDRLLLSRFRKAELLVVDAAGNVQDRLLPPTRTAMFAKGEARIPTTVTKSPAVAWRLFAHPEGGALMLHQRGSDGELASGPGGYLLDDCQGLPVEPGLTHFRPSAATTAVNAVRPFALLSLLVDGAIAPDGQRVAVVSASVPADRDFPAAVVVFSGEELGGPMRDGCIYPPSVNTQRKTAAAPAGTGAGQALPAPAGVFRPAPGELTAVAFTLNGNIVVQSREPAHVELITQNTGPIVLSAESRRDTGHEIFHRTTSGVMACASCHPEGREDGRVWTFEKIGKRRTQPLIGGIAGTAPFHWDGDLGDLRKLLDEVYTGRMGGKRLSEAQAEAVVAWLGRLPPLRPSPAADSGAVARGKALFFSGKTACGACHRGDDFTNHINTHVGTGGCYQVPQLNSLAFRAPYMHDGCAETLRDRFSNESCGGGDLHGFTSGLTPAELDDLIAYLESL